MINPFLSYKEQYHFFLNQQNTKFYRAMFVKANVDITNKFFIQV